MRLSCLAITVLLLASSALLAQHSSGASSSGGGSHSSGGSSAGSFSSGSWHSGSGSSVSHTSGGSQSRGTTPAAKNNLATTTSQRSGFEKRHFFSLPWHKKSSPQLASWRPVPCFKGQNCTPCAAGSRKGVGMCSQPEDVSCFAGQVWNGSYCAGQNWRLNDCAGIANQLEAQRRHMQGLNDPGQSLIYRALRNQYLSCLSRQGLGLRFYALNDLSPFNIP